MKYTMKVYKDLPEYREYQRVRFAGGSQSSKTFEFAGHRWAYDHTSFDDAGDFDRLYRFTDEPEPEPEPDLTELRDTFAALAIQGMMANSSMIDNVTDHAAKWLSRDAYRVADAMLAARGATE